MKHSPIHQGRRSRFLALITVMAITLGAAGSAGADSVTREDPDDSPGLLDLAAGRHGHQRVREQRLIVHRVETHDDWPVRTLVGSDFLIFFNTDADGRTEFYLQLGASEGRVEATMYNSRGRIVGYAKATRPDSHTVRIVFPRSMLGGNVDSYRWYAQTVYRSGGEGECGVQNDVSMPCLDRLPDSGTIRHTLN